MLPHRDYPYRIFTKQSVWAKVLAEIATDIDYDNFKDACMAHGDLGYRELANVWETMCGHHDTEARRKGWH